MGTRGQFATQRSGATVEGGPGLLDGVLDVPCDNVPDGVVCRHLLSVHVGELVLDPSFLASDLTSLSA